MLPGGISRALRTIPVMVDIARDVARLCPDAHFFNYGNPMTANVSAMIKYSGKETIGLCHGLRHVQAELAAFIGKPADETSILYCGLNHLTWIYDFRWRGDDAWPLARKRLEAERDGELDPEEVGHIFSDGSKLEHNPFGWTPVRTLRSISRRG